MGSEPDAQARVIATEGEAAGEAAEQGKPEAAGDERQDIRQPAAAGARDRSACGIGQCRLMVERDQYDRPAT